MNKGTTINVALNPLAAKQLRDPEVFYPAHLEITNGVRTDAGFFKMRPGYEDIWDIGVDYPIMLLIPKVRNVNTVGFAVTTIGTVYELFSDRTSILLTGTALNGVYRPTWCEFDDLMIIADGQIVVKIDPGTTTSALGGSPPAAKYCAVVADRVVLSGYNDTDFVWSDPGTAETWPAANTSSVTGNGEQIRYMQVAGTDIFFFKDASIEIWAHIGGTEVFGRRAIIPFMSKFSRDRGLSSYSVVQGDDTFFFYADGDFWALNGFQPVRISAAYKREIGLLLDVDMIYGFHFAKEHVIRWFEPVSGRCFVYDYVNQVFTEDYAWERGEFARLPIYSYAEMGGQVYVGDYDPTGTVYRWADDLYSDNGTPIHLLRRLRIPFANGNNGRVNRLRLRFQRGSGATAPVTTLPITANLAAWYRYGVGIAEAGSGVSVWADQSGNGRDLLQATDTNRPAKQSDGSILCDGVDNFMQTEAFVVAQPLTIYVLMRAITWGNSLWITDGLTIDKSSFVQSGSTPAIVGYAGSGGPYPSTNELALGTYGVITGVFNNTSSTIYANNGTEGTGTPGVAGLDGFTIGGRATPASFTNVQFKELIIYSGAHDASQRFSLINYLLAIPTTAPVPTTGNLLVRWAMDEGVWTPYATLDMGDDGEQDPYLDVYEPNGALSLGIGREMKLEISQAVAVPHLLTHALLTVEELGN